MITVGRVCLKIAGRDAGQKCVVTQVVDKNFVMIAGATRNRKCNITHLEPLDQAVDIKSGASGAALEKALSAVGISLRVTKAKKPAARPRKKRAVKKAKSTATPQ